VIILAEFGSEEACLEAFRNGAIDYMKKPFVLDEMNNKVELVLKIRTLRVGLRQPLFAEQQTGRPETPPEIPAIVFKKIRRAIKYIDENYMTDLSISVITKEAGMNRTYFCTYFKRVTGRTFKEYLVDKRLARAQELLRSGEIRICDVAGQVGYSPKHFPEVFKRAFHIPPSKSKN
jgi:AraC-like DNA-binding protein